MKLRRKTVSGYPMPDKWVRPGLNLLHTFLHFVVGFLTLWLVYYQLTLGLERVWNHGMPLFPESDGRRWWQVHLLSFIRSHQFPLKSALETTYLVVCVVWGNIGWDRMKILKAEGPDQYFFRYLFGPTGVVLLGLPFLLQLLDYVFGLAEGVIVLPLLTWSGAVIWGAAFVMIVGYRNVRPEVFYPHLAERPLPAKQAGARHPPDAT